MPTGTGPFCCSLTSHVAPSDTCLTTSIVESTPFIAANASTRDLINEGMPRLREAFQEHGTETAYKDLGTANQGADDGKPTASGNGAPGSDKRLDPDVEGVSGKNSQQLSADGLDVLV